MKMATGPQPLSVNEQLALLVLLPPFMSSLPNNLADNPAFGFYTQSMDTKLDNAQVKEAFAAESCGVQSQIMCVPSLLLHSSSKLILRLENYRSDFPTVGLSSQPTLVRPKLISTTWVSHYLHLNGQMRCSMCVLMLP